VELVAFAVSSFCTSVDDVPIWSLTRHPSATELLHGKNDFERETAGSTPMHPAATLSTPIRVGALASRDSSARRVQRTALRVPTARVSRRSVVTRAGLFDKLTAGKSMAAPNPKGQNLIRPRKLLNAKGETPWYIDETTGKAPGYLQITVFMASQLFVGLVMQPFAVWYGELFDPIINR